MHLVGDGLSVQQNILPRIASGSNEVFLLSRWGIWGLQVGVVSSHGHEDGHVTVWDKLPEVDAIHVCAIADEADVDVIAGLSPKVASKSRSLEELLDGHELDAVGVCVRPDLGPPTLSTIVEAGLPVLFDKPAATRADDMRAVAELAAAKGVTAGAMFQWRYAAPIIEAKRALNEGGLGDLWAVELRVLTSQLRYRRPDTNYLFKSEYAGSGILSWLGCHVLDQLFFVTDDRVVEVTAMIGNQNPEPVDVEDTAMVVFRLANGAMGTLYAGYLMAGPGKNPDDGFIALRGSLGYLEVPTSSPWSSASYGGDAAGTYRSAVNRPGSFSMWSEAPGWETGGARHQNFDVPPSDVYGGIMAERLFSDFLKAARDGSPAPSPIEDSVHMLEVVEAAKESSRTRQAVRLNG